MFELELPERFRRYVPLTVWLIVAFVLLLIPFKIISYGYLPDDDALRYAAKAVSGKTWPEILVLGDAFKIDHNLGWNGLLGAVHGVTGWNAEGMVVFSVVALFLLVNGAVLPWLKRPEAWLAVLLTAMIVSDVPQRFLAGRPFALSIAALMVVLIVAQKSRPALRYFLLFSALITAGTYFHGVWYLWLLPVAAFFFAGEFSWALLLAGAWLAGTAGSGLLTGHPVVYISNAFMIAIHGLGQHATASTEVTEFRPFGGGTLAVFAFGALVGLRMLVKLNAPAFARSPAFWLMCGCWMLGFRVDRFWEDWGWPALMVLMATDLERLLQLHFNADSLRRLLLAMILGVATFLAVTADFSSRYTQNLTWQFLTPEAPGMAGWMPEPGGVLYSADMNVFYRTFYKNPAGEWRYILGYESTLMPAEDFKTFKNIIWNHNAAEAYLPWVEKMKPADRLVIPGNGAVPPNLPQLEWNYGVTGLWIGRLPRTNGTFNLLH